MITEPTSSVLILRREAARGWLAALVWHPRLECWLPAGGHVEPGETPAQAAVRETLEETGLDVALVPDPATLAPAAFPHRLVPAPWLVAEVPASPDSYTAARHVHIDHVFVAIAELSTPVREPEHEVRWFRAAELATAAGISEDSRLLASALLARADRWPPCSATRMAGWEGAAALPVPGAPALPGPAQSPLLIVVRGNSASGKSSVAAGIRTRYGRGLSIVSQDNLRRVVLREHDIPGGANIGLIDLTARHAIRSGFHVVVEGILRADYYGTMLTALIAGHASQAFAYYLDIPLEETLRRHQRKAEALKYGEPEMRQWYRERDLLPGGIERVITSESSLDDTIATIVADTGLDGGILAR